LSTRGKLPPGRIISAGFFSPYLASLRGCREHHMYTQPKLVKKTVRAITLVTQIVDPR
jgi:hypothetical protein